jgi:hypothetical protein
MARKKYEPVAAADMTSNKSKLGVENVWIHPEMIWLLFFVWVGVGFGIKLEQEDGLF